MPKFVHHKTDLIKKSIYILFVFLCITSCKGLQFYSNQVNPAGLSILMKSPSVFYYNIENTDSIEFLMVNHNSSMVVLPHWWTDLWVVGNSRFYAKEISIRPQPLDLRIKATNIEAGDTVSLIKIPVKQLLNLEKSWLYKQKPHYPPHVISKKKYHPYIRLTAEYRTTIPNQTTTINIRSTEKKINISTYTEPIAKSKVVNLLCSTDQPIFNVNKPSGNIICKIDNVGSTSVQLFNDAGSIRFKLYAYNPNRTTIMSTEMVLDNGKLPLSQLIIAPGKQNQLSIPMDQLFFITPPAKPIFYWVWNKKSPPISPLVYGKSDVATETECWFGIVVEGKEYISNPVQIKFAYEQPKKKK